MRLIVLNIALVTLLVAAYIALSDEPRSRTSLSAPPVWDLSVKAVVPARVDIQRATAAPVPMRYYFDVTGHTPEEIQALLSRAHEIYDETPAGQRQSLEITMVLHGPDVDFFARRNYADYKPIVELAAELEATGYIDFKACAVSIREYGINDGDFPAFIDIVPYAGDTIPQLENAGYVKL